MKEIKGGNTVSKLNVGKIKKDTGEAYDLQEGDDQEMPNHAIVGHDWLSPDSRYRKENYVQCFFCGITFVKNRTLVENVIHEIYRDWSLGIVRYGYEGNNDVFVCARCHHDPNIFNREHFLELARDRGYLVIDKIAGDPHFVDWHAVLQIALVRHYEQGRVVYEWKTGKMHGRLRDWVLVPRQEYTPDQIEMARIFRKYNHGGMSPKDILDDVFSKLDEKEQDEWLDFAAEHWKSTYRKERVMLKKATSRWVKKHPEYTRKKRERMMERIRKDPEALRRYRERCHEQYRAYIRKVRALRGLRVMFGEGIPEPMYYHTAHNSFCDYCHRPYDRKPLEGCTSAEHAQKFDHRRMVLKERYEKRRKTQ